MSVDAVDAAITNLYWHESELTSAHIEDHEVKEDEDEVQYNANDQLQLPNHSLGILTT